MLDPAAPSPLVLLLKRLFSPFACLVWALVLTMGFLGIRLVQQKWGVELLGGSGRLMEEARSAMQLNDWSTAKEAIQKIPTSKHESPEYLRLLADYLKGSRSDPVMLSKVVSALAAQGAINPQDLALLCQDHLKAGRIQAARDMLQLIPASLRSTLAFVEIEIAILRQEGRQREAGELEKGLFATFADDPEVALNKAVRELDGTFPEVKQSALNRLWELAGQDGAHGLSAIRLLAKRSGHTLPDAERLLHLTDKNPSASAQDRLEALSHIMRLAPERRKALLDEETARFLRNPVDLRVFAAWLVREEEFDRMQQLLAKNVSLKSEDLFILTAQGLAQQKRWTALLEMLKKGRQLPVADPRAATWRALAVRNLRPDDTEEVRGHLREAIFNGAAQKNSLAVLGAARMAEEWAMPDLALQAYLVLAEPGSRQEGEMLEKCWQAANASKDEGVIEDLARRLATAWPRNKRFVLRHDYLRLLRGERIAMTGVQGGEPTEGGRPSEGGSLLVEAMKAYRLDDLFLVGYFLRGITDVQELTVGERAVYAGLLAVVCGKAVQAYQIAEKIHPELLLEGEKQFLDLAL